MKIVPFGRGKRTVVKNEWRILTKNPPDDMITYQSYQIESASGLYTGSWSYRREEYTVEQGTVGGEEPWRFARNRKATGCKIVN